MVAKVINAVLRGVAYIVGSIYLFLSANAYFGSIVAPLLLLPVATLVHELGHAVAVKSLRWKIVAISVWPIEYNFSKRRFGASAGSATREIGGYVEYVPGRDENWLRDVLVAFAGPAANIVLTVLCILIAWWYRQQIDLSFAVEPSSPTILSNLNPAYLPTDKQIQQAIDLDRARRQWEALTVGWPETLAVLSMGVAITNLVPFQGSDGRRIARAIWHRMKYRTGSA
jgi:Zn-dependent protease